MIIVLYCMQRERASELLQCEALQKLQKQHDELYRDVEMLRNTLQHKVHLYYSHCII